MVVADVQAKPVVRFNLFENPIDATLWASVPQFGIGPGFDWCVGGTAAWYDERAAKLFPGDPMEKAIETLKAWIRMHCFDIIERGSEATEDQRQLAQEIVDNRLDFELVEDSSISTYWTR